MAAFLEEYDGYTGRVLALVGERGPLVASDLPAPDEGDGGRARDTWGWTPQKTALEAHFLQGSLAVHHRRERDFARIYDLAERVIPDEHRQAPAEPEHGRRELVHDAARVLGVATVHDLADFYRLRIGDTRPHVAELVQAGRLEPVDVQGGDAPEYLHPEAPSPGAVEARVLLSPFDPVTWFRPRLRRLFDFDYRLEIFIPEAKRKWGYYVLPFLLGNPGTVVVLAALGLGIGVAAVFRGARTTGLISVVLNSFVLAVYGFLTFFFLLGGSR